MVKTDAEIAREALAILTRDGWCKGALATDFSYDNPDVPYTGAHCIGGAVNLAAWGSCVWYGSYRALMKAAFLGGKQMDGYDLYARLVTKIMVMYPDFEFEDGLHLTQVIAQWNNDERITEADVRAVLEKIAAG